MIIVKYGVFFLENHSNLSSKNLLELLKAIEPVATDVVTGFLGSLKTNGCARLPRKAFFSFTRGLLDISYQSTYYFTLLDM